MQESMAFTPQLGASGVAQWLWLVPAVPMVTAGVIALLKQPMKKLSSTLAIGSLGFSLLVALTAFAHVLSGWSHGYAVREVVNFSWIQVGTTPVDLGWVLDPLAAVMLVMVTFVGLLIFIYSTGYMEHDENYTRFFCFLSLFAGAMLGVVIANSILLLFMCWELVGLTSYLLIGFWYQKPSAAAAAKKAFLTTRVGDVFFFLGIVWLFAQTGTLLFYDNGAGSMEPLALGGLLVHHSAWGLTAAGAIGLLIFAGAAGVYLIARVYPLMAAGMPAGGTTTSLTVVTWVGASTAVFAALIAVAQNDIKRILAYSTVSQLGYMMAGLGAGGVAVGMFHLITHAFFKALLFMGAGSVIHGVHEEQDIRKMGGLKGAMPVTFATYAIGMLALCGFPLFSGFWSKDGILEAEQHWSVVKAPYYMLVFGALLTAFYMTRQVSYVFFGRYRGHGHAHESPRVMTMPLAILAFFALTLGAIGTPAWPWFRDFLNGNAAPFDWAGFNEPGLGMLMLTSSVVVLAGLGLGWWIYGSKSPAAEEPDALEKAMPPVWAVLRDKFYIDELYGATVIAFYAWWAKVADWLDQRVWGGIVAGVALVFRGWAQLNRFLDANVVDGGFDKGCEEIAMSGGLLARIQSGRGQMYLRLLALAVVVLAGILIWSSRP